MSHSGTMKSRTTVPTPRYTTALRISLDRCRPWMHCAVARSSSIDTAGGDAEHQGDVRGVGNASASPHGSLSVLDRDLEAQYHGVAERGPEWDSGWRSAPVHAIEAATTTRGHYADGDRTPRHLEGQGPL